MKRKQKTENLRVLQLIDSLRSGGAERMAVNYANAFTKRIDGSYLCCTRMEGLLRNKLSPSVVYLFLEKKGTLDLQAFSRLRNFVKKHKIDLIQAHSSSWFLGLLVRLTLPEVKLVWHDHYGKELEKRRSGLLKPASRFFNGIISVNMKLEQWAKDQLNCKEIRYVPNFLPELQKSEKRQKIEPLKGHEDAFKVICVANLRPQKDHITLLKAFNELLKQQRNVSLHLVGKDNEDAYSQKVKSLIEEEKLQEKVFLYGEKEEIFYYLEQANLGVLSSISEGLPVVLLEYGRAKLPVVCTRVGQCSEVIGNKGKLVVPGDPLELANAILRYAKNEDEQKRDAAKFHKKIEENFCEKFVFSTVLSFYQGL